MKIFSFCFAFAMVAFSSLQAQINVLSSFDDVDGLRDYGCFEVLSDQLQEVRVVGMGESTHGTSEFFSTRLKMFRFLVEKHGFNTLYLEDEYATCLALNAYINGQDGSAQELVLGLSNWPWRTEEFVDVIEWMKQHNQLHPQSPIRIVGVDMQDFQPAFEALDQLFEKQGMIASFGADSLITQLQRGLLEETTRQHISSLIEEAKNIRNQLALTAIDSIKAANLFRHLGQTISSSGAYERSFRDVQMAENLLIDLNYTAGRKGFFWAHNGHVCKLRYKRNNRKPIVYWAGGKLKEELGKGYFVVLQDFYQGSFNAWNLKAHYLDKEQLENYNMGPTELGWESERFFAFGHQVQGKAELMTVNLLKPRKKYILFHSIGAEYTPPNKGGSKGRGVIYLEPHYYDCVLLVQESSPSKLLSKNG